MVPTVVSLPAAASRVRVISLALWLLLSGLVVLHQIFPTFSWAAMAKALLYWLPLLAPLSGLIRGNRYTYSWATLCVLPYFIVGVTEAVANPATHLWATALLGFSLLWFFALISFLRVTSRLPRSEQSRSST